MTESTQTLTDGNRITSKSTAVTYRDSEGRTRREMSLSLPGMTDGPTFITINDPVAKASLSPGYEMEDGSQATGSPRRRLVWHCHGACNGSNSRAGAGMAGATIAVRQAGGPQAGVRMRSGGEPKTESLGKRAIDGILADGTRSTITIPAGEVGNERDILIVTDGGTRPNFRRWSSVRTPTLVPAKRRIASQTSSAPNRKPRCSKFRPTIRLRVPTSRFRMTTVPTFASCGRLNASKHSLESEVVNITISKENYLKAIAEAQSEGETVIAASLARWLNVSPPAVTAAIKRLKRDDLIHVAEQGEITLTPQGQAIANRVLNRHHLIERMLTEIFGMEWYKVHDEAEQLEHAVSEDFERRLAGETRTRKTRNARMATASDWIRPNIVARRGWRPLDEFSSSMRSYRSQRVSSVIGSCWSI